MISMGIVVGLALLFSLSKMSWPWKLRILSSPFLIDALIFIGLTWIHWGTFAGVLVATIGAMACSVVLSLGRWMVGYIDHGTYVPGALNMSHKLV